MHVEVAGEIRRQVIEGVRVAGDAVEHHSGGLPAPPQSR